LPHAAADTEHVSRVEGARQAVDQIFDCVLHKRLTNLKGTAPEGYSVAGAHTVAGVGRVTANDLTRISARDLAALRTQSERVAGIWGALSSADAEGRAKLSKRHGKALLLAVNRQAALLRKLGIEGPFEG
jgi:hypothetical protein